MRRFLVVFSGLVVLGVAGLYVINNSSSRPEAVVSEATLPEAAENPRLEITVAGEANGTIVIDLFADVAPQHVARIIALANEGAYDNVVFHRVIDGFMAQTGDVQFGKSGGEVARAGQGGSELPDLEAEFSDLSFDRGVVGMARSNNLNSANSQFFIMFAPAPNLNGQYTIVGEVVSGLDILDAIKRGLGPNGAMIGAPDVMQSVTVAR
ncbi:peptidylprolyl isomerase [Rhodobacteraceae bacterium R_SAG10]|nr:peptidylprolyl isomerase [Rhodobacteraceae bacterium R_SAG10]